VDRPLAINAYARTIADRVLVPIARVLVRMGATANWMTFFGMALTLLGAGFIVAGAVRTGVLVVAVGGIVDALDGSVARVRGTSSAFGAFYDSVVDRVADVAVFGATAWLVRDDPLLFGLTLVGLGAAQVTSYMRAKAESLGWRATVGVIERAERLLILLVGLFFQPLLPVALWVLAVGGLVTVGQRFKAVLEQADTT
jgi:CDP-diacylglycerol---glycerol-3-phosphate 3-phosphatidyltransferase